MSDRSMAVVDAHVLLFRNNQVLLLRRQNTGYEDGKFCLIAGHLEAAESIAAAAIREAREEAGVTISEASLRFLHVMHNNSGGHRIGFFFKAETWAGNPCNNEPRKCSQIEWFDVTSLPDSLIPYQRDAITAGLNGVQFSCRGW